MENSKEPLGTGQSCLNWCYKVAHGGTSLFVQGSPDLKAAREVANYLGTLHKEFHFTVKVCSLPLQSHATLSIQIASIFCV